MGIRMRFNWNVLGIFAFVVVGFIVAGFLVSPKAETDDGHPLNIFFWGMAGIFLLSNLVILTWVQLSNRRRDRIDVTWIDAQAEILEVSETGTYINNQPRLRFRLSVNSPVHPYCEVVHKQVMPLTALAQLQVGNTITVKVNPDDPGDLMIL
ncbi:hypothetical protein DRQ25_04990 [Candidatus Fermentibacteria bacterium]|nr:MAG: hypothetical protein DRQ25_04990 [Candidatus Fermentibacteria bacterium]